MSHLLLCQGSQCVPVKHGLYLLMNCQDKSFNSVVAEGNESMVLRRVSRSNRQRLLRYVKRF